MQVAQHRFRNVRDLLDAFDFQNETQLFASMSEPEANETFVLFLSLVTKLILLMRGGRCRHKAFKVASFHKTSRVDFTQDAASATLCEPLGDGRNLYQ